MHSAPSSHFNHPAAAEKDFRVAVIGAGIGGLVAAIDCARQGFAVDVFEQGASSGGKIRTEQIGSDQIDVGPTVFTMREVFEQIFDRAGYSLEDELELIKADTLARHWWPDGSRLDLFADPKQTEDAIARMAGAREAAGFRRFSADARRTFETLEHSFMHRGQSNPVELVSRIGSRNLLALGSLRPFSSLWQVLGQYFKDQRLRQLFARYSTYCGSSPFDCPATLMLIAHAEARGVWLINGGMIRLAQVLERIAGELGVNFHFNAPVRAIQTRASRVIGLTLENADPITADAVICNADATAITDGLFGEPVRRALDRSTQARSLSAMTFAMQARVSGDELQRHNVFFSSDYPGEFDQLFRQRIVPDEPTVYVCAQRRQTGKPDPHAQESLMCLINAPAVGGQKDRLDETAARLAMQRQLGRCGVELTFDENQIVTTGPAQFNQRFPATDGALYGRATHGWRGTFARPGATTRIAGLFMAGGSVHPGAGLPMAAISGQLAAHHVGQYHRDR